MAVELDIECTGGDLERGGGDAGRSTGPTRISLVAWVDDRSRSAGYAVLKRQPSSWDLDLVTDERASGEGIGLELVLAALGAVRDAGGGTVNLWVARPSEADDRLASSAGLRAGRELFQMRRPLPVGEPWSVAVRPFRPGIDDAEWLAVNNRAFADHPEQGAWDEATLQARLAEPWFDARGFLLHERDGRLAAFCWTKVHTAPEELGEIFVIAVDPAFHRSGLGREMTLAGLDHLAQLGIAIGMLYVDTTNQQALALYDRLGFSIDHVHRAYTTELRPS